MHHVLSHHALHRVRASARDARAHCQPYPRPTTPVQTVRSTPTSAAFHNPTDTPSTSSTAQLLQQQRARFTSGLIDVAVRALCDIWPTRDIPTVFAAHVPAHVRSAHVSGPFVPPVPSLPPPTTQLPSPPTSPEEGESAGDNFDANQDDPATNAATLRGFVIDVLRRSRTSTSVFQTALCYLEALRVKVPELVALEAAGLAPHPEADQSGRVVLAADIGYVEEPEETSYVDAGIRDTPATPLELWQPGPPGKKPRTDPASLAPAPPLPSPLLDPRRAFIAALVLASKFAQDKCYSNRAWAKLAGLPPREIGRCERALGDALGWRLWVGKQPKALGRTATEPDLMSTSKSAEDGCGRGLRRSSTLPAPKPQPLASLASLASITMADVSLVTPIPSMAMPGGLDIHAITMASPAGVRTPGLSVSPGASETSEPSVSTPGPTPEYPYALSGKEEYVREWNGDMQSQDWRSAI